MNESDFTIYKSSLIIAFADKHTRENEKLIALLFDMPRIVGTEIKIIRFIMKIH